MSAPRPGDRPGRPRTGARLRLAEGHTRSLAEASTEPLATVDADGRWRAAADRGAAARFARPAVGDEATPARGAEAGDRGTQARLARRASARRDRRRAELDVALGVAIGLAVLLLAPGLGYVAIIAVPVLLVCMLSLVRQRWRARVARRAARPTPSRSRPGRRWQ